MATKIAKTEGEKLHAAVTAALKGKYDFDERDEAYLGLACQQLEDLVRLEDAIERDGTMILGSTKQRIVNPAIAEARQARLAILRLLGAIDIPLADKDEGRKPNTAASRKAAGASRARWGELRAVATDG